MIADGGGGKECGAGGEMRAVVVLQIMVFEARS